MRIFRQLGGSVPGRDGAGPLTLFPIELRDGLVIFQETHRIDGTFGDAKLKPVFFLGAGRFLRRLEAVGQLQYVPSLHQGPDLHDLASVAAGWDDAAYNDDIFLLEKLLGRSEGFSVALNGRGVKEFLVLLWRLHHCHKDWIFGIVPVLEEVLVGLHVDSLERDFDFIGRGLSSGRLLDEERQSQNEENKSGWLPSFGWVEHGLVCTSH